MAFVKIVKNFIGSGTKAIPEVRMSCHLQSEKQSSRSIGFALTRPLIEAVGWPIEKEEDRTFVAFDISEGVGEDAGFLQLSFSPQGYKCGTKQGTQQSFHIGVSITRLKHYILNDHPPQAYPHEPVEFSFDANEKTILVQVPDWLRYDPTSVPKPVVVEDRKQASPPTKAATSGKAGDVRTTLKEIAKDIPANRQQRRAAVSAVARRMS